MNFTGVVHSYHLIRKENWKLSLNAGFNMLPLKTLFLIIHHKAFGVFIKIKKKNSLIISSVIILKSSTLHYHECKIVWTEIKLNEFLNDSYKEMKNRAREGER